MKVKVKKASLKKGRNLEVTLTEFIQVDQGSVENEVTKKCSYLAHQDLVNAFDALKPFLIEICEMEGKDEMFKVSGFSVGGDDEGEGVVLIGSKKLNSGKVLNLTSPFVEYFGDNELCSGSIYEAIETCITEVESYLDGKCAIKQMELEFDAEDAETKVTISTEGPKRRGRKKAEVTAEVV